MFYIKHIPTTEKEILEGRNETVEVSTVDCMTVIDAIKFLSTLNPKSRIYIGI